MPSTKHHRERSGAAEKMGRTSHRPIPCAGKHDGRRAEFPGKMKFDDPDLNIMPTDIHRMMDDYKAMTDENTMLYAEEDENVNELLKSLDKRVGNGIKVSELGPTEMRQLSVVIRSVSHLVRNANKMVSIKNGQKISAIGDAYMEDVQNKKQRIQTAACGCLMT